MRKYISLIVNEFQTISNLNWLNIKSYLRLIFLGDQTQLQRILSIDVMRSYVTLTRRTFVLVKLVEPARAAFWFFSVPSFKNFESRLWKRNSILQLLQLLWLSSKKNEANWQQTNTCFKILTYTKFGSNYVRLLWQWSCWWQ